LLELSKAGNGVLACLLRSRRLKNLARFLDQKFKLGSLAALEP